MSKVTPISRRKSDHVRLNLEQDVQSEISTGLEKLRFDPRALPEMDLDQVNCSLEFLGRKLHAPILISSMTGGTEEAGPINQNLARAAQAQRIAMGVGSMRAAIEDPHLASTFKVRQFAPDILLFANLGAVQLNYGFGIDECKRAVDMIQADGLILHLNALQEALQPEGNTHFQGLLARIEEVCRQLTVPVIAKEVGWGISRQDAELLANAGVAAVDIAGAGGTSWSQVEMHRAEDALQAKRAAAFADWGIPTAEAIKELSTSLPHLPLIASGGLRTGIDMAKCIALGADLAGIASPLLKAAVKSEEAVIEVIELLISELRICMFATGCRDLASLRSTQLKPR